MKQSETMLKKLFKSNKNDEEATSKLETLISMGFNSTQARHALDVNDFNLERATNYLLSGTTANTSSASMSNQYQQQEDLEQQQLQNALNESMKMEQSRRQHPPSAASLKAGQAAAARAQNANKRFGSNGKVIAEKEEKNKKYSNDIINSTKTYKSATSSSSLALKDHPNVKMPTQMKDKGKEEQIKRCANRLAPYPTAVNTLHRALTFIRQHPDNDKYRKIDRNSSGYQRTLEGKPGAMDFLMAMNFVSRTNGSNSGTNDLIMDRNRVDMALLFLGITALEKVKETEEYKSALLLIEFEKELRLIQNGNNSNKSENEEILKRAEYISKLPSEPSSGAGALMQISLGDEKIMRRFDGDDILRDVINFIGGHGSVIPEKIASREWCLIDMNQYPLVPIDVDNYMNKTLQYIGCWPSGMLALKPSTNEWKEGKQEVSMEANSRGLGAANASV